MKGKKELCKTDMFVKGLVGIERQVAKEWAGIPNVSDCPPELIDLYFKYRTELVEAVSGRIETLRQELGIDYNKLQSELKRNLI